MKNQQSNKKGKFVNNQQGSGSEYHREHAGNVQGYGSNDVETEGLEMNNPDNSNQ